MKKTYNVDMANSVKLLVFESVKEGLVGIESVINEFLQSGITLVKISTHKSEIMYASYDGAISFKPIYYKGRESAVYALPPAGFRPKGNNVMSTGVHEMGHILEKAMIDKNGGGAIGVVQWADCTYAKAVVKDAQEVTNKLLKARASGTQNLLRNYQGMQ